MHQYNFWVWKNVVDCYRIAPSLSKILAKPVTFGDVWTFDPHLDVLNAFEIVTSVPVVCSHLGSVIVLLAKPELDHEATHRGSALKLTVCVCWNIHHSSPLSHPPPRSVTPSGHHPAFQLSPGRSECLAFHPLRNPR